MKYYLVVTLTFTPLGAYLTGFIMGIVLSLFRYRQVEYMTQYY